ncbi:DUF5667 domain-containing protein [Rossellomorea sp. AcN35-11]|nr:DUF5667 domain-containing protein [Rossellomorea aquimaris]WJV29132.1 DUF5667 domain-containing protein [Rossellomorea sp. AcN35-11]
MTKHSNLIKSSLAVLVAGSISLSGSLAYADESEKTFDTVTLEQKGDGDVAAHDEALIHSVHTQIEQLEETDAPSLLPGDFFYFAKLTLEKVKLAFTMDDAKEAKLLAEYAAERLAEVEALFAEGKEEEAVEAINHAIEMIQRAGEGFPADMNENSNDDAVDESDDSAESEVASEENNEETEDSNEEGTVDEEDGEERSDDMAEVENLMAQNIIALKANLEKVENPKVKAALQRNIEKSYVKLAEKLAKLEEKRAETEKAKRATETGEVEVESEDSVESAPISPIAENPTESSPVEQEAEVTAPVKDHKIEKEDRKEVQHQQKVERKEAKEVRKQEKAEEKQSRHNIKQEKNHQPAAKQKEQQGNKGNGNGKENGKGHNKE